MRFCSNTLIENDVQVTGNTECRPKTYASYFILNQLCITGLQHLKGKSPEFYGYYSLCYQKGPYKTLRKCS